MVNDAYLANEIDELGFVKHGTLTRAIQKRIGMQEENAKKMAEYVLNFFGYDNEQLDNRLNPDDRTVFYILEENGILSTKEEENTLYDGRLWRSNYWILRHDKIKEILNEKTKAEIEQKVEEDVYSELSDDVWERSSYDPAIVPG